MVMIDDGDEEEEEPLTTSTTTRGGRKPAASAAPRVSVSAKAGSTSKRASTRVAALTGSGRQSRLNFTQSSQASTSQAVNGAAKKTQELVRFSSFARNHMLFTRLIHRE